MLFVYSLCCNQNSDCHANFSSAEDMAGPEKKVQHYTNLTIKTGKIRPTRFFTLVLS